MNSSWKKKKKHYVNTSNISTTLFFGKRSQLPLSIVLLTKYKNVNIYKWENLWNLSSSFFPLNDSINN